MLRSVDHLVESDKQNWPIVYNNRMSWTVCYAWNKQCHHTVWVMYMQVLQRLTPWLMGPRDSMPHSWGPSNNPYPIQFLVLITISVRSILVLFSHLRLGFPKGLFPAGVPVKILKALLPSSNLATWPAYLPLAILKGFTGLQNCNYIKIRFVNFLCWFLCVVL